jgi:hypothetical protein
MLDVYSDRFDPALIRSMERAIELAVAGETDRVKPSYTNIALMKSALDVWAGGRFGRNDWIDSGHAMADAVFALFEPEQTFSEYNSPTYYGVNLGALQIWRRSPSPMLRERGKLMEAAIWRDVARFYHAGMKNLSGPFDRAYGMDMQTYCAGIGGWIGLETGIAAAPYPDLNKPFEHRHDFCAAASVALLGTEIPQDVKPHLHAFGQPRLVERVIEGGRIASAWLDHRLMFGGERGNTTVTDQYHPATLHWLTPGESVGTLKLIHNAPVDVTADRDGLTIVGRIAPQETISALEIICADLQNAALKHGILTLPGLHLEIISTLTPPKLIATASGISVRHRIPTETAWTMKLRPSIIE